MRTITSILTSLVLGLQLLGMLAAVAQAAPGDVPEDVRMLEGTYTGEWTMYGIDGDGDIVKTVAWTDTVEAGGPQIENGRAFVTTSTVMTFEGGQIPQYTMQGREGYVLNPDGGLGHYFIEVAGKTHRMVRVGDNVWSYTASADANELISLGFPATAAGQHVLVKVVAEERGVEMHRISRLTTVRWKDDDGEEQVVSYVSLKGHHLRQR